MKIRMKTLMAGPGVLRHPGEVCVVGAEEAAVLVDGGYAEAVDQPAEVATAKPEPAEVGDDGKKPRKK